jgi:hypothetical protein
MGETMQTTTRRMFLFAVVAVASVVVFGGTALAQNNPFIGTWKLNVAKSKFDPGPPPMNDTRRWEAWETNGVTFSGTRVLADGKRLTFGYSAHYDGKDYRESGWPDFDTIALKRIGANTVVFTLKKGGKVVAMGQDVVSSDGKMLTTTRRNVNAKGQKVRWAMIFDKQ